MKNIIFKYAYIPISVIAFFIWFFYASKSQCPDEGELSILYPLRIKGEVLSNGPVVFENGKKLHVVSFSNFDSVMKNISFYHRGGIYGFIQVGDSIFKEKYHFDITIKKKSGEVKVFEFKCPENSFPPDGFDSIPFERFN